MNIQHKYFYLFIVFCVLIDQGIKQFLINFFNIDTNLLINDFLLKANDYLNIVIVWNRGFAFGMLQNSIFNSNILNIFLILSVIIFLFFYVRILNGKCYFYLFSMIIGGAIGNLIDRVLYGAVVDFIDLHYQNLHWYVFNIADIYISIGCTLLILFEIKKKLINHD